MELQFKTRFCHADFAALEKVIEYLLINVEQASLEEKLMLACLAEIHLHIRKKKIEYKSEYKLTLTAPQAIALRLLYAKYMQHELKKGELMPSLQAKMLLVAASIDQQYQI